MEFIALATGILVILAGLWAIMTRKNNTHYHWI